VPSRLGSPNKNKQALIALLEAKYPGYHPVVEMAGIANDMSNDVPTRLSAHKEVAQYVTPKLKAIEVQVEGQIDARIGWLDSHTLQSETPTGSTT
jgi:hypothetical protein